MRMSKQNWINQWYCHVLLYQVFHLFLGLSNAQINKDFFVTEECPLNTVVGNLNIAPYTNHVSDTSLTTAAHVSFQLLSPTNLFYLNESSGLLYTRSRIDRETICPENRQPDELLMTKYSDQTNLISDPNSQLGSIMATECQLQLQALQFMDDSSTQGAGQQHRVILIRIYIIDINDNAPSWQENFVQISIPEHSRIGTRISLPAAFDPDCGPLNTTVSYSLIDGMTTSMSSVSSSLPHSSASLALPSSTGSSASSMDTPLRSDTYSSEVFHLDIEPVGGPDPSFGTHWNNRLPSGQQQQQCMPRMFRLWLRITQDIDRDGFDDSNPTNTPSQSNPFRMESIKLKNVKLTLLALDGGQPVGLTGTVTLNITITDINDHAPEFLPPDLASTNYPAKSNNRPSSTISMENGEILIRIPENSPTDLFVYRVLATDKDESDRHLLQFGLDSSASLDVKETFRIDSKSGEITLKRSPDYEKIQSYTIPITVSDGKHTASQKLKVQIQNQNDHPPIISVRPIGAPRSVNSQQSMYSGLSNTGFMNTRPILLYVTEHDPPGQFIATVTVTDVDDVPGSSGSKSDQIVDPNNDPTSQMNIYNYHIPGLDPGMPIHCQLNYNGLILEPLFKGAKNQFKLLTQTSFDREQQSDQFVTITCYDKGQPPLSAQVGMRIIIEDINDHGPIFKQAKMVAHLKENSPPGTLVFKVEAHDPDIGLNAQLGFQLDGQHAQDFAIDPKTGQVSSLRPFDREQVTHFNLTVLVHDQAQWTKSPANGGHSNDSTLPNPLKQHSATGSLLIYIDDVNDCVPTFENSLYQLTVPEDAKINHLVGLIEANDSDATEVNNHVHYIIKHMTESQPVQEFRISSKGYIYVARGNLDREKTPTYNFYLVAIDSGVPSLSSSTQVHIYLTDVNDNAPQWIFPAHNHQVLNLTISEPVGYRVAQLKAEDPDEGKNGDVSYRLVQTSVMTSLPEWDRNSVSPAPLRSDQGVAKVMNRYNYPQGFGNLFELDSISGAIYVGRSMSMEDIGSIKIVVEASDGGTPAKINHRVLQINIFRYLSQTGAYLMSDGDGSSQGDSENNRYRLGSSSGAGGYFENDLVVIVIMVAVTLIISLILILAILFLRCGACPNRGNRNPTDPRCYQHTMNHTHHLEEVFRDSGTLEANGLLAPCPDQMDNGAGIYQHHQDTDTMLRSILSSPDDDQWLMTTPDQKKILICPDTIRSHKLFNPNHQFHISPSKSNSYCASKKPGTTLTTGRLKRVEERLFESTSDKNSPDHELKLILGPCQMTRPSTQPCSTFRSSCSQLNGLRLNSPPCKDPGSMRNLNTPNEPPEDIESMDSGHGCSTDTGVINTCDSHCINGRPQTAMTTFRMDSSTSRQTPNCICAVSTNDQQAVPVRTRSPDLSRLDSEDIPLKALTYRQRSGTLPLNSSSSTQDAQDIQDPLKQGRMSTAKSSVELLKTLDPKCCLKSQTDQNAKNRLSVSWLDTHTHLHCPDSRRSNIMAAPITSPLEPQQFGTEMTESTEGTMVLFSPVDPLGYAQLVHAQNGDRSTPNQNIYTKFPTSFV